MHEDYLVASVRHLQDAKLLHDNNRVENALCHYAFSAECAIKVLYNWSSKQPPHSKLMAHDLTENWNCILDNLDTLCAFDPKFQLVCPTSIPSKLFDNHPSRRYLDNYLCSELELKACEEYVISLHSQIISILLDNDFS